MELEQMLFKVSPAVRKAYLRDKRIIDVYRAEGHALREQVRQNPVRNGHLLTREMHPSEWDVLKELCPDLGAHDPRVRLKAMYWVLNKEWGMDFRASPFEKRYHWVDKTSAA